MSEVKIPAGYKQTEVGVIPEDWKVTSLGIASNFINGRAYSIHEWETTGIPVIRLQNLTGRSETYYYSNLQLPEKQYCKNGDLLFMWSATFGPVIWRGPKAIYHYHIWKVECNPGYNQAYVFHLLNDMTEKLKQGSSSGGTMLHITKQKMESIKAAFPSVEEQTAIANVLTDTDNLIQSLEKLIAKKEAIKTGTMQQLLTGKTRLPEFATREDGSPKGFKQTELGKIPEDWGLQELSELTNYINDGTHHTPSYIENGVPFYSVENVTANDFINVKNISLDEHNRLIKRCKPEKGDILMTRIGTLGATRIIDWDIDASIYVSLALIKMNDQVNPFYIYEYSKSNIFIKEVEKRSLVNATPPKINMSEIGKILIAFPQSNKEQTSIATILSDMDAEIQALKDRLEKTKEIKQGMMQQLLTGKVRLVSPDQTDSKAPLVDSGTTV